MYLIIMLLLLFFIAVVFVFVYATNPFVYTDIPIYICVFYTKMTLIFVCFILLNAK